MLWAKTFAVILAVLIVVDVVWLTAMKRFYRAQLRDLVSPNLNWTAAVAFYFVFAAGLMFFVVLPSEAKSLGQTALTGAFFGLVTYGTYDLTNQAILARWSVRVTVVDMFWGMLLSTITGIAGWQTLHSL